MTPYIPDKLISIPSLPEISQWWEANQQWFKLRMVHITASCRFPLTWVKNPEWIAFYDDFLSCAEVPFRKVLMQQLIPAEVKKYRNIVRESCCGLLATIQCNSWTALNTHHLMAFIITVNWWCYTVHVVHMMWEVIDLVEKEWGATVRLQQQVESCAWYP